MRKHRRYLLYLFYIINLLSVPLLTACVDEEEFPNTAQGNFEALWKIIDEHYCFFDYKQHEYGLDWNDIYNIYIIYIRYAREMRQTNTNCSRS